MGIGATLRKVLSHDSRPDLGPSNEEQRREPLSPSQTKTSPTEDQDTKPAEQQAVANDKEQPAIKEQLSHPPLQERPSRSPNLNKPRRISSAAPQHITERYEIMERELAMDAERARAHGIAGYGSDAAAAAGASLQEVHQAPAREAADREGAFGAGGKGTSGVAGPNSRARKEPPRFSSERDAGNAYRPTTAATLSPASNTGAPTEGSRVKHTERHIHHVQHHIQPIIVTEELPEEGRDFGNAGKAPAMIEQGVMTVTETVYHHIYHVIQPVIEKETVNRHRVHPTIPMHEVIHQTPIVERTQTHSPVPMQEFLEGRASLSGNPSTLERKMPPNPETQQLSAQQELKTTEQDLGTKRPAAEPVHSQTGEQSTEARAVN